MRFYCHLGIETTVRVEFVNRILGRTTLKGATASENGATLAYSSGPTDRVAIMLFSPRPELCGVNEDHICLSVIAASAAKRLEKLRFSWL